MIINICVCRIAVHLSVQASVFFTVYYTVQEGQTVSFDPGVIHIPENGARSTYCEGDQGSALNLFYVEAGHYWHTSESVCRNLLCAWSRWSSYRRQVRHKCGLGWSWFSWTEYCPLAGVSMQYSPLEWECILKVLWHHNKMSFYLCSQCYFSCLVGQILWVFDVVLVCVLPTKGARILVKCLDKHKGCAFALARAAGTFNHSCSAAVSASLLFLLADSIAVMRSATGI